MHIRKCTCSPDFPTLCADPKARYTSEEKKALKVSSEVMETTMAKVGKKLRDAEARFRESQGSSDNVVLRSVVSPQSILSAAAAV
jgi:hypothetical protein